MKPNIIYIISQNGTINAIVNGKNYTFDPSSEIYEQIKTSIREQNVDEFLKWVDFDNGFRNKSNGKVTFEDGVIRYNGSKVDNLLSRRIIELYSQGFDFEPLIKFLENCYANPNPTVVDRLYTFMESQCIMIDVDGYVVGYKKVNHDGWDYYSHTIQYEVGKAVEVPREKCDSNSINTCSTGLHIGNLDYVLSYHSGQGKILICRTHPKDVTAIPEEGGAPKLRSCRLEVIEEYTGQIPVPVYNYTEEDCEDDDQISCGDDDDEGCDCQGCNTAWRDVIPYNDLRNSEYFSSLKEDCDKY